ncbi:MAG: restriction endonuclease subunit S [Lachnospiraceae bacterium]|nr:restriction endonuclease subunit S [Lachnospiraceae bacterium]MDE6252760.1 restriction endonuclease subunit S [Lachnospiraceae bacterium]
MSKFKISDFIDRIGDGIHGTPHYITNGDYFFINGNNLVDGQIVITSDTLMISKEEYNKIKRPLNDNTILLSINGTLGKIAMYEGENVALGKSACYINVKNDKNKYFLKYILSTKEFQKYILLVAHGSTIKNLAPSQVADYEFDIPDGLEQDKVAFLLKALDDKIHNNNKINSELESMIKMIYDYWFLQFEFPNEEGKPYKSSGGEMVWNEELKREIPENWKNGTLEDVGEIVAGGTPSTEHPEYYCKNGIAWITPNDLSNLNDKYITHGERDISEIGLTNSSAKLMPKGTVLLTSRAPIGYIGIAINAVCTNQGFKSIVPNKKFGSEFIYYTIQKMVAYLKSLGTGSTFTEISKNIVAQVKIVLPEESVVNKFEKITSEISSQRRILEEENRELNSLREFLLPLLMNGQVGFKD